MKVSEAMTRDVHIANPEDSIQRAAQMMQELDAGIVPVGDHDRLVGMISDRDIAIRAVAAGMGPNSKVREIMSSEVKYCFADQEMDEVTSNMGDLQIRRLPVMNREKRLVGILSLGDVATSGGDGKVGEALGDISRPGGRHSQGG